jgi:hypothetical protein
MLHRNFHRSLQRDEYGLAKPQEFMKVRNIDPKKDACHKRKQGHHIW